MRSKCVHAYYASTSGNLKFEAFKGNEIRAREGQRESKRSILPNDIYCDVSDIEYTLRTTRNEYILLL